MSSNSKVQYGPRSITFYDASGFAPVQGTGAMLFGQADSRQIDIGRFTTSSNDSNLFIRIDTSFNRMIVGNNFTDLKDYYQELDISADFYVPRKAYIRDLLVENLTVSGDFGTGVLFAPEGISVSGFAHFTLDNSAGNQTFLIENASGEALMLIDATTSEITFGVSAEFVQGVNIGGAVYVSNTLEVDDVTTLNSNLFVNGSTTLSNTLDVNDTATFNSNVIIEDTLQVSNTATFSNTITVEGVATFQSNAFFAEPVVMSNTLDVSNAATFSNTITVEGVATFQSNAFFTEPVVMSNTLAVSNTATFSNTVTVEGVATFESNAFFAEPVFMSNTLDVSNAATFSNTVTVEGVATFESNAFFAEPVVMSNTLAVSNTANFGSNVTIDGTLQVGQSATFSNTANFNGAVTMSNALTVQGNTTIAGNLNVIGTTTSIYSTTVTISDNILVLNYNPDVGVADAGFIFRNVANISGSGFDASNSAFWYDWQQKRFIFAFLTDVSALQADSVFPNEIELPTDVGNNFMYTNIKCGEIECNQINVISDQRLKTNVRPLGNTLNKIKKMRAVRYKWKRKQNIDDKEALEDIGFLAQEVEAVFPEMVTERNGIKTVSYQKMVVILLEAMKEQQKQLDDMNARLATMGGNGAAPAPSVTTIRRMIGQNSGY